jgi:hypothetical protein
LQAQEHVNRKQAVHQVFACGWRCNGMILRSSPVRSAYGAHMFSS